MEFIQKTLRVGSLAFLVGSLAACSGSSQHQDLKDYMEETLRRPPGQIEPLPPFVPYQSFSYSAMALRSPFEPPVQAVEDVLVGKQSNVKPDLTREKEFLEQFNLANLRMVGTLSRDGTLWALINDGEGGIHRVKEGNYMGRNHGKIIAASPFKLEIIEIVPDGADGWIERPQVLQLAEKE